MNYPKILAGVGLGCLALVTSLRAETLVQYTFTANDTTTSRNASITGSNVTSDAFANGAGVTISSSTLGSPDPRSYYVNGNLVEQTISATSTDWLGFTINANSGYTMNLANLSFAYGYSYNSGTAPTEVATFDVRSSVDNYTSSLAVLTANATLTTVNWSNASIVLTDAAFQSLGSISFRIILNDGTNANSASFLRIDTVTLTGAAAAVPEPAVYGVLAGLSGLALACVRRCRRTGSGVR